LKASASNCKEIVEILLENGANVNSKDKNGKTSLMWGKINIKLFFN
jgi:ankyrin repeat protein